MARSLGPLAVSRIGASVANPIAARIPHVPTRFIARLCSPARAWTEPIPAPPQELRTVPGIRRDAAAEKKIHEQAPPHEFFVLHRDAMTALGPVATMLVAAATTARLSAPPPGSHADKTSRPRCHLSRPIRAS